MPTAALEKAVLYWAAKGLSTMLVWPQTAKV